MVCLVVCLKPVFSSPFFFPTRSCVVMLKKHTDKTLNCNCVRFQIFVDAQSTHHLTLKECCFVSNCRLVGCLPHKSSARGLHTHIHTHAHTHTSEARARVCGQNHTIYEHLYGNHRSRVIIVLMKVDFFFMVSLQAFFFFIPLVLYHKQILRFSISTKLHIMKCNLNSRIFLFPLHVQIV